MLWSDNALLVKHQCQKRSRAYTKDTITPETRTQTLRCSQGNYCQSRRLLSSHNILLQVNVLLLEINNINGAEGEPTRQQEASLLKTVIKNRRVNCSLHCSRVAAFQLAQRTCSVLQAEKGTAPKSSLFSLCCTFTKAFILSLQENTHNIFHQLGGSVWHQLHLVKI